MNDDLSVFSSAWPDGYFEGNPLDPSSPSSYGEASFVNGVSMLHLVYLRCIKPYIDKNKVALEIGPGRGAWSKCMLGFKDLWLMDPASPDVTGFYEYIGRHNNVHYLQIGDLSCSLLLDNSIDYMFSFGCLCHVSFDGVTEYARNLFNKLRSGAECFWMINDATKFKGSVGKSIDQLVGGSSGWHILGTQRVCDMLSNSGYVIIESDVGSCPRDPIVHFRK